MKIDLNSKLSKIILTFIVGFFLILFLFNSCKIKSLKKSNNIQAVELMSFKDSANILRTKNGKLYSQIQNVTIEKNALKGSLDKMGIERNELKKMEIKWRDLAVLYKAKLESSDTGSVIGHDTLYLAGKDTIWGKKFDDWTNINLSLSKLHTDNKKLFFEYKYQTEINYSMEKSGKNTKITLWLSDKHAQITTGSQITINRDIIKWHQKWWLWGSVGLVGGYFLFK